MSTDPAERFRDRARAYVRGRPGYPAGVVDLMRAEAGLGPDRVVADVGSGTGILTRLLLDAGARVHAVEPNEDMRSEAERTLGGEPGFVSVAGRAEATGLEPSSVDLVTAAQALHWFDAEAFRAEARRILRPGGRLVVLWNRRRSADGTFLRAYEAFLRRWGTDYEEVRASWTAEPALDVLFGPDGYGHRAFPNEQLLDRASLRARTRSSSYMPAEDHPDHEAMLAALDALFEAHADGGVVRMVYDTQVYWGTVRGSPGGGAPSGGARPHG